MIFEVGQSENLLMMVLWLYVPFLGPLYFSVCSKRTINIRKVLNMKTLLFLNV